uniref:Uncharacterized protein n=1 Tax=Octopus bimaculoides TaxID=37653 RepID=A0A0L8HIQ0_OCTBM
MGSCTAVRQFLPKYAFEQLNITHWVILNSSTSSFHRYFSFNSMYNNHTALQSLCKHLSCLWFG